MRLCFQHEQFPFAIASIVAVFVAFTPLCNAATSQHVDWKWPLVNVGSEAVDTVHTYNAVDIVNASWTSNLDFNPFLVVWCQAPGGYTANQSGTVPASGWHLVSLNLGLSTPIPIKCHFAFDDLNHTALTTPSSNSGSFNITNVPDQNPQVIGPSTSAAASTITVSAAGVANPTSTAPASAATTSIVNQDTNGGSGSNGGLGAGAIAGIVIGVLLLIGIVVGTLFIFCVRKRRRERKAKEAQTNTTIGELDDKPALQSHGVGELDGEEQDRHKELLADEGGLKTLVADKDAPMRRAELEAGQGTDPKAPAELEGGRDAAVRKSTAETEKR